MADISTQVKIPAELLFQILISSFCDQTTKTFSLLIWLSKRYFFKMLPLLASAKTKNLVHKFL